MLFEVYSFRLFFHGNIRKRHKSHIAVRPASKATAKLLKLKQSVFDQEEKSGKILAWRIKQFQLERSIIELKNDRGDTISDPIAINESFKVYYERLYSPENAPGQLD